MEYLTILKQIAQGIASEFGSDCEIAIHDLKTKEPEHSIVHILNGHVTGRSAGDGLSDAAFDAVQTSEKDSETTLHNTCLTKTPEGKILKCSTSCIYDDNNDLHYVFAISYDITRLTIIENALHALVTPEPKETKTIKTSCRVHDLLEHLIEEAVELVGKPVALMTKEDKITAIRFLNDSGAFLITKSGDKVAKYFHISKYTLYSYIDAHK